MLPKRLVTGAVCGLAAGTACTAPAAATENTKHRITETQRVATLTREGTPGTTGSSDLDAGTLDGKLDGAKLRGALRAVATLKNSSTSSVSGTEFDGGGSRSFTIHVHYVTANGQETYTGTGEWTGGTRTYAHARGSFTITGGGPVLGTKTLHLKGSITY